ncbi:MAG: MarR family winged helix-turn-helix transcriptional regulator [Deltaproteobacteria bacterium]|jgi:DNA-binding MarR family transcriptional regulator|nr:MarR family winged helix-turn-helix transcriptional regulator [Deltaproteobacteria bacterium]
MTCYCRKLRRLTAAVKKRYDQILAPALVTASQYGLLLNISHLGTATTRELATLAELERSTLARNLRPLLSQGLIADDRPSGARDHRLTLTDKGQKTLALAKRLWNQAQEELTERLGPEGLAALETLAKAWTDD